MRICGDRLLRVRLVLRLRLLRRLRRLRRPLEPAASGARSPTQSAKLKAALHGDEGVARSRRALTTS